MQMLKLAGLTGLQADLPSIGMQLMGYENITPSGFSLAIDSLYGQFAQSSWNSEEPHLVGSRTTRLLENPELDGQTLPEFTIDKSKDRKNRFFSIRRGKEDSSDQSKFLSDTTQLGQNTLFCPNPLRISEMHNVRDAKVCVDVSESDGQGDMGTYACDGYKDQLLVFCNDGTVRNMEENFCMTNQGGNVVMANCNLLTGPTNDQLWSPGRRGSVFHTEYRRNIKTFELKVRSTGQCLDIYGYDGHGNVGVANCDGNQDQSFWLNDRGRVVQSGRITNMKSGLCLGVPGSNAGPLVNVQIDPCNEGTDQLWNFYENGEIINQQHNLCMDPLATAGEPGSSVVVNYCDQINDQQFYIHPNLRMGGHFALVNRRRQGTETDTCLDAVGNAQVDDNVQLDTCTGTTDQMWRFEPKRFTTPNAQWEEVSCNMNGDIDATYTQSVNYEHSISHEISIAVESSISVGTEFASASLTTTQSNSLANSWSSSSGTSLAVAVNCKNYDNGTPFTGGCMWQLNVYTHDTLIKGPRGDLHWKAGTTKCTNSNVPPRCPPFTHCLDKECTRCTEYLD